MYESTNIVYNGVSSTSLGLLFIRFNNVDDSDLFLSDREIVFDNITRSNSHKSQSYLYSVQRKPRKFTAEFYCDNFTNAKLSQVAKWLDVGNFAPFYSDANPDRLYYCTLSGSPKYITNGTQGIISVDMQCQDEYSYSTQKTKTVDYSQTTGTQTFTVTNNGDVNTSPIFYITISTSGSTITLKNTTNVNQTMEFSTGSATQLYASEVLTVDCNREIITTDRVAISRYPNMNGEFLDLIPGTNSISVTGNCKITMVFYEKYLT